MDEQSQADAGPGSEEQVDERCGRPAHRRAWWRLAEEAGMSTAEYAVGTVAACAFAAVLYQVVTGGSVVAALGDLVQSALTTLS
jgi:pyrroloquinoline quinone (PQQ) biosynthesis protein C